MQLMQAGLNARERVVQGTCSPWRMRVSRSAPANSSNLRSRYVLAACTVPVSSRLHQLAAWCTMGS